MNPESRTTFTFRSWVPFAYGFRPFFLLCGWFAVFSMGAWLLIFSSGTISPSALPVHLLHGHEMLFGLVSAAIAGFLLTAVPSWTGTRGFGGMPLVVLTLVWLLGRASFLLPAHLPFAWIIGAELAFLPLLAILIAPPLIRSRNRNTPLLGVLVLLWISDFTFMLAMRSADVAMASASLLATLNVVLLLITIIGGRIVPSFTGNALRKAGIQVVMRNWSWLEHAVIFLMMVMLLVDLWSPAARIAGAVAGLVGLLQLLRLSGWNGWRTGSEPIVWILHAGYAWIPLGLLLKAGFLAGGFQWAAFWMHALGAGAAATMILAVMSRASLGHSGRPLEVAPIMAWSYGLLILAVLVRVFGASLLPFSYIVTIQIAGGLWMIAWLIYAVVYAPILLLPRIDGKPG
jgi:uncharacterized protein involved in response to NO